MCVVAIEIAFAHMAKNTYAAPALASPLLASFPLSSS